MDMDGLAKLVGLDIEAIAIEVATKDNSWDEQERPVLTNRYYRGIESVNSTPNEPIKPVAQAVKETPPPVEDIFSPDKINNAF